ncbi:MAG TPA: GNAT family N-acetyltransferase [Gemmatimonadaceae bacterium]|nr:GNAT family N-acetyltransferase [Gemmatimonadaceae bacterium]
MNLTVRLLGANDEPVLRRVAPSVFDAPVDPRWSAEFLADPRHHLAVALDAEEVVGMASAIHYVHPDKAPQLWINEVGVAPTHRGRGIGRRLMELLLEHARTLGCTEAWVLTDDPGNRAAHALYASVGGEPTPEGSVAMYTFPLRGG